MRRALFFSVVFLTASCIVPAPSAEKAGNVPQKPAAGAAPDLDVRNGAILDGKIEMLGAHLSPGRVQAGESIKVTVSYRVIEPISADYMIFVHVEDVDGRVDRINADHAPSSGAYPTSQWKKGEIVKDEYAIYVPPTMPVRGLTILTGFWDPKSDSRMVLKNPDAVRSDNNNRIFLAQIPVSGTQPQQ